MNYPTYTWQELNWYPAYNHDDFFNFCNNVTNIDAPESVTAVDYALAKYTHGEPWTNLGNYANYFKSQFLPLCSTGDYDSPLNGCFGTQNGMFDHHFTSEIVLIVDLETFWADTTNGAGRSYLWTSMFPGDATDRHFTKPLM